MRPRIKRQNSIWEEDEKVQAVRFKASGKSKFFINEVITRTQIAFAASKVNKSFKINNIGNIVLQYYIAHNKIFPQTTWLYAKRSAR